MVAYSFKDRFVEPIEAGTKNQTIRLGRKNPHPSRAQIGGHALPGEELQLYNRMRRKDCRLIKTAVCMRTIRITIELVHSWVDLYETPGRKPRRLNCWDGSDKELDPFARADGFADWKAMWDFWAAEYPEAEHRQAGDIWLFDGFLIEWMPGR